MHTQNEWKEYVGAGGVGRIEPSYAVPPKAQTPEWVFCFQDKNQLLY